MASLSNQRIALVQRQFRAGKHEVIDPFRRPQLEYGGRRIRQDRPLLWPDSSAARSNRPLYRSLSYLRSIRHRPPGDGGHRRSGGRNVSSADVIRSKWLGGHSASARRRRAGRRWAGTINGPKRGDEMIPLCTARTSSRAKQFLRRAHD